MEFVLCQTDFDNKTERKRYQKKLKNYPKFTPSDVTDNAEFIGTIQLDTCEDLIALINYLNTPLEVDWNCNLVIQNDPINYI